MDIHSTCTQYFAHIFYLNVLCECVDLLRTLYVSGMRDAKKGKGLDFTF